MKNCLGFGFQFVHRFVHILRQITRRELKQDDSAIIFTSVANVLEIPEISGHGKYVKVKVRELPWLCLGIQTPVSCMEVRKPLHPYLWIFNIRLTTSCTAHWRLNGMQYHLCIYQSLQDLGLFCNYCYPK